MKINKEEILKKHCYTDLVYGRINKKLGLNYSKKEIKHFIKKTLLESDNCLKKGKNFYISNLESKIRITVNSYTFRIITVDKI